MIVSTDIEKRSLYLLYGFVACTVLLFAIGVKFDTPIVGFAPLALLVFVWAFANYKSLFFLLVAMLPISVEYYFSDSLATDLPTEPLMIGMMGITLLLLITRHKQFPFQALKQKLFLLLLLHLFWILLCAIQGENFVHSFKVFLSKLWYVTPFSILVLFIIRSEADIRKIFWCLYIPLTLAIVVTLFRHGYFYHFYFEDINRSVGPYFRNHVNYAAMVSIFFPWLWLADKWYPKTSLKYKLIQFSKLLYVVAIYFSYTRTCMLALLAMIPFYFVIKWDLMKPTLIAVLVVAAMVVANLVKDNHYLKFAPDFKRTIYHDDFSSHLTSTFAGEDVSSMERVYRWVAAKRMFEDRPWMGVGNGNFYEYYKKYAVAEFETYISDNEERSTVHNYFLLILVEQGAIGLAIFVLLTMYIFLDGNKRYQETKDREKRTILILLQSMVAIYVNLLLSDMLESDKVGTIYFMIIGLLVALNANLIHFPKDGLVQASEDADSE